MKKCASKMDVKKAVSKVKKEDKISDAKMMKKKPKAKSKSKSMY